jgi:hypothetical protein
MMKMAVGTGKTESGLICRRAVGKHDDDISFVVARIHTTYGRVVLWSDGIRLVTADQMTMGLHIVLFMPVFDLLSCTTTDRPTDRPKEW